MHVFGVPVELVHLRRIVGEAEGLGHVVRRHGGGVSARDCSAVPRSCLGTPCQIRVAVLEYICTRLRITRLGRMHQMMFRSSGTGALGQATGCRDRSLG